MSNVYMDVTGKYYVAASPNSPNDCLLPFPRPEMVAALTTDGVAVDQDTIDGQTANAVIADGTSNPNGQAGI